MNTKGVEDGIGDEQAVRQVYQHAVGFAGMIYSHGQDEELAEGEFIQILGNGWADARAKLPAAPPEDKPTFAYSLAMRDEVAKMIDEVRKPGEVITEVAIAQLWPLLVELVERRKR